jgi:hypothetical protein
MSKTLSAAAAVATVVIAALSSFLFALPLKAGGA